VQAAADAPAEWKALAARASRQLEQVDVATAALEKIVQGYHDELLGLARKWMGKDDVGAEAALRRALLVRPGSRDAVALLSKMGRPVVPPTVIFDGGSTEAFEKVRFPTWQVEDGFLIGDTRDGQFYIRTLRSFEGDFDVRVEARFLEQRSGSPYLALLACRKGDYDHYSVGVHSGDAYFLDMTAEGKAREIADVKPSNLKQSFDPMQWNTYEFRARAGEVVALINGEEFGREPRSPKRDGGFIGLVVQDARVAYRRVEVQPR
jgi:hypothetical protein